jgi:hypothetical protein
VPEAERLDARLAEGEAKLQDLGSRREGRLYAIHHLTERSKDSARELRDLERHIDGWSDALDGLESTAISRRSTERSILPPSRTRDLDGDPSLGRDLGQGLGL